MAGNANYPTDLLSTTWQIFMKDKPSDEIFGDLVMIDVLSKRGKITKKGGVKLLEPLMYAKSSAVGSYSGYDTLDTSPQQGLTNAEFDWKQYFGTVSISSEEDLKNSGDAAKLNLLEARFTQAKMSLADRLDSDSFLDGTGNNSKNITGLAAMVANSGTYGNIARASNTWWNANQTAVSGVLAIAGSTGLRRAYNAASLGRARNTPNLGITTQIIWEAYEATMDANMRYAMAGAAPGQGQHSAVFGNSNLMFRDMPLFWDGYCQSGILYTLNTDFMKLVVMSGRDSDVVNRDGNGNTDTGGDTGDFRTEPFQTPVNQDARIAKFFWMANLVASNCRFLGKLTGITNT